MGVIEGKLDAAAMRFGIIASRFNGFITERLLDGALGALRRHGAHTDEDVAGTIEAAEQVLTSLASDTKIV